LKGAKEGNHSQVQFSLNTLLMKWHAAPYLPGRHSATDPFHDEIGISPNHPAPLLFFNCLLPSTIASQATFITDNNGVMKHSSCAWQSNGVPGL
jgi:hypothetical protein